MSKIIAEDTVTQDQVNVSQVMAQVDKDLSEALQNKIAYEIASASEVVKELEADAIKKGIPLQMSGARYRIYETITG